MFSIGEFARHGRVSVRMLRHYDAIGLLRPASADPATGYRLYRAGQLADLVAEVNGVAASCAPEAITPGSSDSGLDHPSRIHGRRAVHWSGPGALDGRERLPIRRLCPRGHPRMVSRREQWITELQQPIYVP
jgi:MerR family regulatory protein